MMKIRFPFTFLLLLCLSASVSAQITRQWVATYNGSGDFNDRYTCVTSDAGGNIYIGGSTVNPGTDRDYLLVKLSASGTVLWSKQYNGPGSGTDEITAITTDANGNVYVTGFAKGLNTSQDFFTIKYNSNGDTLWTRAYDFIAEYDQANSIFVDASGNVYITGQSDNDQTNVTNDDYVTIKYNSAGAQQWVNRYDGLGGGTDRAVKVVADASGNVYITGRSDNGVDDDYVTIKYNNAGVQQWIKYDDRGGRDRATAMAIDASNNLYITGRSDNGNNYDFWTLKYNAAGTLQWQQPFDFVEDDNAAAITVDAAGVCYVTGQSDADASALLNFDYQTVAYSANGTQLWQKRYDGTAANDDSPLAIAVAAGNVYVTGLSDGDASAAIVNNIATLAYTSNNGTQLWAGVYSGNPNFNDEGLAVATTANGCVAVGFSEDANQHRNAIAINYTTAGSQQWTQTFNGLGDNNENVRAIALDGAKNVYAAGYSVERGVNRDFALVKFSNAGVLVCETAIDGTSTGSEDDAQAIALDNNGNAVLAGFTKNKSTSNDIQIASFNPATCDTNWTRTIDGAGNGSDKIYDMVKDAAGNFYITGRQDADPSGLSNDNCYTAKFDANNNFIWQQTYNSGGVNEDRGVVLRVSSAGNVYVVGRSWNGADYDIFILKYNNAGSQQWVQTYNGGNGNDEPKDMALDNSENIYVVGNTEEATDSVYDYVTLKYTSAGTQAWAKKYNGTGQGDDKAIGIAIDANNNVVVTGESDVDATANQNYDMVTVKYDNSGTQLWSINYNGNANIDDIGDDVAINNFGLIYLTGHTNKGSLLEPNYDVVTMIVDQAGTMLWSDIYNSSSDSSDIPNLILLDGTEFYVAGSSVEGIQMRNMMVIKYSGTVGFNEQASVKELNIYPNPFDSQIQININDTNSSQIQFDLLNITGQTIYSKKITNGTNTLLMPYLANGLYMYRLSNNGSVISTGKLAHSN